jgi:3-deoxy-7-phosphoheptulonate synthase
VSRQVAAGSPHVFGVMIESHLVEGRQDARPGIPLVHGQSITDACLSLDRTVPLLEQLAQARASVVRASRARRRVRSGR